jgi:hypothetical protein
LSSQIPGVIPGQPWRPPVSGVSQPLYGQIQPATTGQSAIYPSRPATSVASASQVYPQVPHATVPGISPSGQHSYTPYTGVSTANTTITQYQETAPTSTVPSVGETTTTSETITNNTMQLTNQQTAQKTVPKVVLVYSDNEVSMVRSFEFCFCYITLYQYILINIFLFNRKKKEQNLKNIDIMRINSDSRCMLSIYLSNIVLQILKGGLCDGMLVLFLRLRVRILHSLYIYQSSMF